MGLAEYSCDAFGKWVLGGKGFGGVWLVRKCGKVEIFREDEGGVLVGFLRFWLSSRRDHENGRVLLVIAPSRDVIDSFEWMRRRTE